MKEQLNTTKGFSRHIKLFKQSEYYEVFLNKLKDDFRKYTNDLLTEEDPIARGKVQYIKEIFSWYNAKAEEEEVLELDYKKQNEDW